LHNLNCLPLPIKVDVNKALSPHIVVSYHQTQICWSASRRKALLAKPLSLYQSINNQQPQGSVIPATHTSTNTTPNKRQPIINMRSAFVVAAFAAGALAVPLMEREVVWETDVVYATQYVTVTAGDVAPTAAPPAYSTSSEHWGHRKKKTSSSSKTSSKTRSKPTSSSVADSSNDSPKAYSSSESSSQDSPKATSSSSEVQEAAKETAWAYSWATTWSESAPTSVEEQAPAYTSEKSEPAPTSYDAPKSYSEAPTSTRASSSSNAKPTGYQGMVLHHHNIHRQNHSAPDLAWSDALAATAQKIGETCVYAHSMYVQAPRLSINI
jgi:hypothetical protein